MQEKVSNFLKKFKKVIDNETKVCYYIEKVKINETNNPYNKEKRKEKVLWVSGLIKKDFLSSFLLFQHWFLVPLWRMET